MKWKELTQSWRAQGFRRGIFVGFAAGFLTALALVLAFGCGTPSSASSQPTQPLALELGKAATLGAGMGTAAGEIRAQAAKLPDSPPKAAIDGEAVRIVTAAGQLSTVLDGASIKDTANTEAAGVNAEALSAATAQVASLKDAAKVRLTWWWTLLVIIGSVLTIAGIGVNVLAGSYPLLAGIKPLAKAGTVVGIIALVFGVTMLQWAKYLPYVGAAGLVAVIGYYIWALRRDRAETAKELADAKIATSDLVAGADAIKNPLFEVTDPAGKDRPKVNALLTLAQAPETKAAVDEIRNAPPATPEAVP